MTKNYFKLYACCIPVKGAMRSGISDLQRAKFTTIPNDLYDVLELTKNASIPEILADFDNDQDIINEYIEWLIENEFGFFCSEEEHLLFPAMDNTWHSPRKITNAIYDLNHESFSSLPSTMQSLIELGVPCIQIRAFETIDFTKLIEVLEVCKTSRINQIDIVMPYYQGLEELDLVSILRPIVRINTVVFYNSPTEGKVEVVKNLITVIFSVKNLFGPENCGCISDTYFVINKDLFLESQHHNSCLNRKLSIDQHGEIKNCPSMAKSFGNIRDTTLQEAISDKAFQELWNISKDDIKVCQDCEFRYICTDCRAYLQRPEDLYSKPLKCGYDPYTAKWEDWRKNPESKFAIEFYGVADC